jgi:branched-chain amino acid transport system permease protein
VPAVPDSLERPLATLRQAWDHPRWGAPLKVAVGYVVLVEIIVQLVFGRIDVPFVDIGFLEVGRYPEAIPRGTYLGGMVIGVLYSLIAIGLILIYRANRIINFAQAQLGAVPAIFGVLLVTVHGWPWLAVLPLVLLGAVMLGAGVEVVFVRRFRNAPRLILTVVTIGAGFVLVVAEFLVKLWLSGDLVKDATLDFPTPFSGLGFTIDVTKFSGDHVVAVLAVAGIVIGLGAFFKYTDMGIAVRASAENAERASLLGIPVARVSLVVWVLAAVLSAIGVFLRVPIVGMSLTGYVGPGLLLYGLAAAVMARMESLPLAMASGMFIGIIDRSALYATNRASLANAAMFVVIMIALLVQRGKLSRAQDTGTSTWQAVKDFRPIPAELRNIPEVVRARTITAVVAAGLLLLLPFIVGDGNTGPATKMLVFAMVGVSLVILTGWAGQISLGQFAIAGIGAATAGGLAANYHWDFFLTLIIGGLAGALVAVVVGLPAVRIQGLFLAVTTLAFAFTVSSFVLTREFFGWLMPKEGAGITRPILWGKYDLTTDSKLGPLTLYRDAKFYYVVLAFLVIVLAAAAAFRRNRSGRILIGARDNGRAVQAFGVNLVRTRLAAFAISGFIAALAGALFAYQQGAVDASTYGPEFSIQLFVMTVIGGIASLPGAVLGAAFVVGLPLLPGLRDIEIIEFLTSGIGVVLILYFMPGGLAEGFYRLRDNFLRKVAAKRDIHVPSLVADSLVDQQEQEAEEQELIDVSHGVLGERTEFEVELIGCPQCGARIPVDEAQHHAHFQVEASR